MRKRDVGVGAVRKGAGGDIVAAVCTCEEDGSRGDVDAGADGRDVRGGEERVEMQRDAASASAEVEDAETAVGEDGGVG